MEKDPPSNTTDGGDDVAVYHIYHNHRDANKSYSIHSLRDSHAPLSVACTADLPTSISRASTLKPQSSNEPALGFWARQKIRAARAKAYDKPGKDPRTETAPYFLHSPKLYFRSPPYTLRKGGNKRAEVVGLLKPNFGWMKWEVQFGDVLKQEGVVDGRGVVNWRYGTKNGEYGTLKGYPEREKRYLGESGKAWFNLQKEIGDTIPEADEKAKPEETVRLRWVNPLLKSREYRFLWRGYEFAWKGTTQTHSGKGFWGYFMALNHLKLVVITPLHLSSGEKNTDTTQEIVLAVYTSAISKRKAGKLHVFWDVVEEFLEGNMVELCEAGGESVEGKGVEGEVERTRERLKNVVVATGVVYGYGGSMGKRQVLWLVLRLMIYAAGGST